MRKEVRLLTGMRFSEISLVDHPACDKATVTSVELVKRSENAAPMDQNLELNPEALKAADISSDEAGVIRKFFRFLLTPPNREDQEREEVLKRISDPEMRKRVEATMKGAEDVPTAQKPPGAEAEMGGGLTGSTLHDARITEEDADTSLGKGPDKKSKQQVAYLLSDGSPLTAAQKKKLKDELHSGAVIVAGDNEKSASAEDLEKREFSQSERDSAADSGAALPDGSFPIHNKQDLSNAIHAIGRAKDPGKAKAHIKRRARALGATDQLPDDWKSADADDLDKSLWDVTNFAQVVMSLDGLTRMSEMAMEESEEDPDDEGFITKLKALRDTAGALLVEMTQHEVGEFKMGSPEDIQKAARMVLDALNGAAGRQRVEKAGAKFSASTMNGLKNCKRSMDKASGFFAKAGDKYPDDDDISDGNAHLGKAADHLMKTISWSEDRDVNGDIEAEPDNPVSAATRPYKTADAGELQKALTAALGPLQEQIGGLQSELKAAREENAGLRKQVEAIGGLPAPSRIHLGTGVAINKGTADSSLANAARGGNAEPQLQIDPNDRSMSKAGIPTNLHKAITLARREPIRIDGQPGSSAGAI